MNTAFAVTHRPSISLDPFALVKAVRVAEVGSTLLSLATWLDSCGCAPCSKLFCSLQLFLKWLYYLLDSELRVHSDLSHFGHEVLEYPPQLLTKFQRL